MSRPPPSSREVAASSQSEIGQAAAGELVRMDLPQNPGNSVATAGQLDGNGRVVLVVQNRAPIRIGDIQVKPVPVDAAGRIVQTAATVRILQALGAGERIAIDSRTTQSLRLRVDGALEAE